MNIKEIKEMISLMNENGLVELEIEKEGMRIRLKKTTSAGEAPNGPILIDTRRLELSPDGLLVLTVLADAAGGASHQFVPLCLADLFVDAFIRQEPYLAFEDREQQQDPVGIAGAVKAAPEERVDRRFFNFGIDFAACDERALEGRPAFQHPVQEGEEDGEKAEEEPHVLRPEPQPAAQEVGRQER